MSETSTSMRVVVTSVGQSTPVGRFNGPDVVLSCL